MVKDKQPEPIKAKAHPHPIWTVLKWGTPTLLCIMALMVGTYAGILNRRNALARAFFGGLVSNPLKVILNRDPLANFSREDYFPPEKHVLHVLLLGCDHDYEKRRPVAMKNTRGRSDAILLARVDFDTPSIRVLSIPRDSAVEIPNRGVHKINAAHAFGGPDLTIATIKSVFGVDIDYYAAIHFDGFKKVVDAVGGVEVDVEKKLDYDDNWGNLHIHLKPGLQRLNGYQAMGYVRMRHSDSDLMRSKRQQKFLEALRAQIKNPANVFRLPDVLDAITDSLNSNMTHEQMLTLANFARSVQPENIRLVTLPSIEGPSYVYIKPRESEALIKELFYPDNPTMVVYVNSPGRDRVAALNGRRDGKRSRRGSKATVDTTKPDSMEEAMPEPEPIPENDGDTTETNPAPETAPERKEPDVPKTSPETDREPSSDNRKPQTSPSDVQGA
jgi:LCP family protein required for cell wall assembly